MDYALLPPEVNSGRMYAGPGPGPMLAAAAGWDAVAANLESAASGYASQVSGLSGQAWSGPSSLLMAGAAAPYVAWLHATSVQAGQTAAQAYGAVAAYEAAFAATVPPPVVAANRAQLAVLVATNFFGQNTPAIAATEAQYAAMWAQDATAMYGYAGASQAASTLSPLSEPPQTTNPAGQAAQARAVTQATSNATADRTESVVQMASTNATHQLATTNTTAHTVNSTMAASMYSPSTLPAGSTLSASSHGAYIASGTNSGIVVTVTSGYPVSTFIPSNPAEMITTITQTTFVSSGGVTTVYPAGKTIGVSAVGNFVSGSFTFLGGQSDLLIPAGGYVTGGAGGAEVLTTSSGAVISVNSGAIITGPAAAPVAPSASGGLGAAMSGLTGAPGLAGTSAIQPQLNAPLLAEWARGVVSGVDLAADVAGAAG